MSKLSSEKEEKQEAEKEEEDDEEEEQEEEKEAELSIVTTEFSRLLSGYGSLGLEGFLEGEVVESPMVR